MGWRFLGRTVLVGATGVLVAACGGGDGAGGAGGAPTTLVTLLPATIRAGDEVAVKCLPRSGSGELLAQESFATTVSYEPADAVRTEGSKTIASRAGSLRARCSFADRSLTDDVGATARIVPGSPARVVTSLDQGFAMAGEPRAVACETFDAEGNAIPGAPATIEVAPTVASTRVTDTSVTILSADAYSVTCNVEGVAGTSAPLTVNPNLAAKIDVQPVPSSSVYERGSALRVAAVVRDAYDNTIASPTLAYDVTPAGPIDNGSGSYTLATEGRFTFGVTVSDSTKDAFPVRGTFEVLVDSSGPSITCEGDGTTLDLQPGSPLGVRGRVSDTNPVRTLTVDGRPVAVDVSGRFATAVTSRFGMNFVEVVATDALGNRKKHHCTYQVANRWQPEATLSDDPIVLHLGPAAVDDGLPATPITSLNDALTSVLNSPALASSIDASLRAANPLKPRACDWQVAGGCLPFVGCWSLCGFTSSVDYEGLSLPGPNTTTLTPVDGGIRLRTRLSNVGIRLGIGGTLTTSGWVTFGSVDVELIADVGVSGGVPRATVRPGSVGAWVSGTSYNFSGLNGFLVERIAGIADGTIRSRVQSALANFAQNSLSTALRSLVGGLQVSSLGRTIDAPRPSGGTVPIEFALGVTGLSSSASGLVATVGTRFSATTTRETPTLGIALAPRVIVQPDATKPTSVVLDPVLFAQALNALWRGGFFDGPLPGVALPTLVFPQGGTVEISLDLPPVVHLGRDQRLHVALGAMNIDIREPSGSVTRARVGARLSTTATLSGERLVFATPTVDEIALALDMPRVRAGLEAAYESVASTLVRDALAGALAGALPTVPIPAFGIPSSMSQYGLPAGRELGILAPTLSSAYGHYLLRGTFGLRPASP
jgi:hypothetical protein